MDKRFKLLVLEFTYLSLAEQVDGRIDFCQHALCSILSSRAGRVGGSARYKKYDPLMEPKALATF